MIDKVQLIPMSGFMHGFLRRLPRAILASLAIILISLLFAYFSATKAQEQFNNFFSPEMLQSLEENLSQNSNPELESAIKTYSQSTGQPQGSSALESYNNLIEQYTKLIKVLTSLGEKGIFWLTFGFSFLFAFIFLNKIYHFIQSLVSKPDPAVEDNITNLTAAVNQLIDQQNSQTGLTSRQNIE